MKPAVSSVKLWVVPFASWPCMLFMYGRGKAVKAWCKEKLTLAWETLGTCTAKKKERKGMQLVKEKPFWACESGGEKASNGPAVGPS